MYGVIGIRLIVGSAYWPSRPQPWVAKITGLDNRFGFARTFIKGVYDYTYSSKGTGKNTYLYFAMPPGIYELYYPISWKHDRRYFAQVTNEGEIVEITRDEVLGCLKSTTSE